MEPTGRDYLYIVPATLGFLGLIVSLVLLVGGGPSFGWTDNGRDPSVSSDPTNPAAVEPRHCAFVDSQRQITVGRESTVTLNLEECVQEVLQRVMTDKNMKVRELILTGKLHADAKLVSYDNGIVIRQRGPNGIQPLRPQPSWLWTVEATRPGRHEVVVEIRTIGPDNDPGVYLSPPITLSMTAVEERPVTTTPTVPPGGPEGNPQPEHGSQDDDNNSVWTAPVIIGLIIAAIAAVFTITGPVKRKRQAKRAEASAATALQQSDDHEPTATEEPKD